MRGRGEGGRERNIITFQLFVALSLYILFYHFHTERLTHDQITALTSSPILLREFIDEQERTFQPSPYSIHDDDDDDIVDSREQTRQRKSRKRRLSSVDSNTSTKRSRRSNESDEARKKRKIREFLGEPPDSAVAVRLNSYDRTEASPAPSTSSDFISRSHNYSPTGSDHSSTLVEGALRDLSRVDFLIHHEQGKGSAKQTRAEDPTVYNEEFGVEKILGVNVEKRHVELPNGGRKETRFLPLFEVKWKNYGLDDTSWEPSANVYDCAAYADFMKEKKDEYRVQLYNLWKELIPVDDTDPPITDADAIKQIAKFNYHEFEADFVGMVLCQDDKKFRKEAAALKSRIEPTMRMLPYYWKRLDQLRKIYYWQMNINQCDKSKNLRVENDVDFEVPPSDFEYTNDVFPGEGVIIPDEPPMGCECAGEAKQSETGQGSAGASASNVIEQNEKKCDKNSTCCGLSNESKFAYRKNRSICVPQGTPIYECNKKCTCGPKCLNRVVQQGRQHSLTIFKTSNGRGWGVRTDRPISKGQFVCEYVGEVITYEETERRGKIYDADGRTYLFDLDFNGRDNPYSVDAAKHGNVSHFINHSCNPNLGVWAVWTDCLDPDLPKIGLFTLRNIGALEEITFDYMNKSCDRDGGSGAESTPEKKTADNSNDNKVAKELIDGESQESQETVGASGSNVAGAMNISNEDENQYATPTTSPMPKREPTECKCGASNCRKVLF